MNHKDLGNYGEQQAAAYLRKQGYEVLAQGYKNYCGEIDIIARKRNVLVFVEVKTRTNVRNGLPCEAVGWKKQQRLLRAGAVYMAAGRSTDLACRFDVVEVYIQPDGEVRLRQIENAFEG